MEVFLGVVGKQPQRSLQLWLPFPFLSPFRARTIPLLPPFLFPFKPFAPFPAISSATGTHQQNASTFAMSCDSSQPCGCQRWGGAPAPKGWASFQPVCGCASAAVGQGRAGRCSGAAPNTSRAKFWGSIPAGSWGSGAVSSPQQGRWLWQVSGGLLVQLAQPRRIWFYPI